MGDGEDGPTHQPVEHLISLRAIPGLVVLRPGRCQRSGGGLPLHHAIAPPTGRTGAVASAAADAGSEQVCLGRRRRAAELTCWPTRPAANPKCILIATGSEVSLAVEAHETTDRRRDPVTSGLDAVVGHLRPATAASTETACLPPEVTARVAVEQGSTLGWERYVGQTGRIIGMKTFGASAPLKELQRNFGFEPDTVVPAAKELLGRK